MSRQLFWKLCLVIATGIVALFYMIDQVTSSTEEGMSMLSQENRLQLTDWGRNAERLYNAGEVEALNSWIKELEQQENTWISVANYDVWSLAGSELKENFYKGNNMGRSVDWKIHLYFDFNPIMEVRFKNEKASFLIQLPTRMRPGTYWRYTEIALQIVIPCILLAFFSYFLYRYIMKPLRQLQLATRKFSAGDLEVRAEAMMGGRNDEFHDLASSFDLMASRIGEQLISQRQLISDLSHELRTPLTRLDIALEAVCEEQIGSENVSRIARESNHVRKLVEDTLNLAWLENEKPKLQQESLELIDLVDVLVEDARYEFADRHIVCHIPDTAMIKNTSHRAAGQAIENILRNALRYTPSGQTVDLHLTESDEYFQLNILDQGPGVPNELLKTIFKPFFRVDKSRERDGSSFGLGLALAQRQLATIRGSVTASNRETGGLSMRITLPKQ